MSYTIVIRNSIYGNHTHILNNKSVLIRIPVKATEQITRFHKSVSRLIDGNVQLNHKHAHTHS